MVEALGDESDHLFFAGGKQLPASRPNHAQRRHIGNEFEEEVQLLGVGPRCTGKAGGTESGRGRAGLCVLTSDVPENREAIEDAGFTFRRGEVADLAERRRFLIANPAVREAAGEAAKRRIQEEYQWNQIAAEIERVYFKMLGWNLTETPAKKPSVGVGVAEAARRRAG